MSDKRLAQLDQQAHNHLENAGFNEGYGPRLMAHPLLNTGHVPSVFTLSPRPRDSLAGLFERALAPLRSANPRH